MFLSRLQGSLIANNSNDSFETFQAVNSYKAYRKQSLFYFLISIIYYNYKRQLKKIIAQMIIIIDYGKEYIVWVPKRSDNYNTETNLQKNISKLVLPKIKPDLRNHQAVTVYRKSRQQS